MKRIRYTIVLSLLLLFLTSCGTASVVSKNKAEIAGYTLKNKKELMEQKILNATCKTVIVAP